MTYFNKQWTEEIVLPDRFYGILPAGCRSFLKANNLALAGDYSDEFRKEVRLNNERALRRICGQSLFVIIKGVYGMQKVTPDGSWRNSLRNMKI